MSCGRPASSTASQERKADRVIVPRRPITTELRLRGLWPLRRNRRTRSWHVWKEEVVAEPEPVDFRPAPVRNSRNVSRSFRAEVTATESRS